MSYVLLKRLCAVVFPCLLVHCAIVGRPAGGERDVTGPQLDTVISSPNFQTDVRPEALLLSFDEFVTLKNANQNVLLTPVPLAGRPKYVQRGREVRVDLSEVTLADSTTYQLQFGEAVQDLNEGNPSANLRYVFSTGSYLDSLQVRGQVEDSQTDEAAINALVGLFRYDNDSLGVAEWSDIVVQASPDYFTRTDSSGRFLLDYLAPGNYYLTSYTDENSNYRFNAGAEQIAFMDTTIVVGPGVADTSYLLQVSPERPPLIALRADQAYPGLLRVTLNQEVPDEIQVLNLDVGTVLQQYNAADTLYVAYQPALDSLPDVIVQYEGEVDTVRVRKPERTTRPPLRSGGQVLAVAGSDQVTFRFSQPLARLELDSIRTLVGLQTVERGQLKIDTADLRQIVFTPHTDTLPSLTVEFYPGSLVSVFDSTNRDTLSLVARPNRRAGRGEVTITLTGLETKPYVVLLLDSKDQVEREIRLPASLEGAPTAREEVITLSRVAPGTYTIQLIDDDNGDGRYSPGSRRLRRQPERVRRFGLQQVRADWTIEERIMTVGELPSDSPVLDQLLDN